MKMKKLFDLERDISILCEPLTKPMSREELAQAIIEQGREFGSERSIQRSVQYLCDSGLLKIAGYRAAKRGPHRQIRLWKTSQKGVQILQDSMPKMHDMASKVLEQFESASASRSLQATVRKTLS